MVGNQLVNYPLYKDSAHYGKSALSLSLARTWREVDQALFAQRVKSPVEAPNSLVLAPFYQNFQS